MQRGRGQAPDGETRGVTTYKHGGNTLGALTYAYDAASQRTQVGGSWARTNLPAALASATYNAANHQTAFGGQTLTYDLNGNLTGDGTNTYTWNARNQLASISGPIGGSFVYDAFGRRQRKTVDGVITDFVYDGLNPVRQAVGANTVDLLTGLGIDEYLTRTDASGTRDLLSDALGSTLTLTDSSGAVQTEYTYEPFGATTASGSTSGNELRYTGREDDGTSLYYYRARYYHPSLQRFISEDPLGLDGGLNVFAFANNNPLRYIDPLGLKALICSRPLNGAGRIFGRHAFIVTDDTTTPPGTLSLFPQNGVGVPTERGIDQGDIPSRPDALCEECKPKGKCGDVGACLRKASQQYPTLPYAYGGPNSNTYAARLARKCCANGFPRGLGITIGSAAPFSGAVLPANPTAP